MKIPALEYLQKQNPLVLAGAAVLVIGAVYYLARKTISDTVDAAGGILSGDNALTKGTPYEGAGVAGTLGAGANAVTGGLLEKAGSFIGGKLYDWFGSDPAASDTFYTVTFPDGKRHAINAAGVSGAGYFTYGGVRYQILSQRARDGSYTAVRA